MEQNHPRKILDLTFKYLAETLAEDNRKKEDKLASVKSHAKKKGQIEPESSPAPRKKQ
jgi:hypothetical protein